MNNNIVYGVIGLLIGFGIACLFFLGNSRQEKLNQPMNTMMHQMPDGSMMMNNGMDMSSMMQGMMAGLEGKTGDAFDKAFLSEMIMHHEGAVEMAKAVLSTSKRPELIKLANDIISAQTSEITMMKGWQKSWFNK